MSNGFNANDIFEIAVTIEQNGVKFYRDAADQVEGEENKKFLQDLALMEKSHEATFTAMQKELKVEEKTSTIFDPENENGLYLKALADTRIFFEKDKPDNSFESILKAAIQAEKDSIVFYIGMKELVSSNAGKSRIDDIIKEEMSHVTLLAKKLTQ